MISPETAIAVENVSKAYHIFKRPQDRLKQILFRRPFYTEFWALRDISFQVSEGEVVGIIGRNGAGKSTLLQIIANTLTPTSGKLHINGRISALLELGSGFNPEFTGRENVYINGAILGLTREQIDARFPQIEAFADIGDFIDRPVKIYSSGMMLRLAFAVSVHVDADLLVIDEALAVGDIAFQFKCLHRLEELLARKTTIILVSHDIALVKSYCQRAIYLKNGRLAFQGDCHEATEIFHMDVRTDQQQARSLFTVGPKPALNTVNGISFGSQAGQILKVEMGSGETHGQNFRGGERVWVKVTAQVREDIRCPRLAMVVRDEKGYNLFIYDSAVLADVSLTPDENGLVSGIFRFSCLLQDGYYSITLRLEEFQSEAVNLLLDKQVNAVNFNVMNDRRRFDGVINLDGQFEAWDPAEAQVHDIQTPPSSLCKENIRGTA